MKKLFFLMAAALMSVAMMAGENDLLWDFSAGAPSANPVPASNNANVNLYYGSKVTDGPGVKNGLYGIKMNGSGYAYFTKPAVAGKLKLGFGPRSGQNAERMVIQTWAGDAASATVPTELVSIDTTGAQTEYGYQIVELTAEQNNIYIKRAGTTESVLQYLQFTENVARTFKDFKIEFRDNPYTVLLPTDGNLPAGVLVENTSYNGVQHGIYGGKITVPVDGPVKFTIGACQFSNTAIVIKKDGVKLLDFSNNASCGETAGHFDQYVTYTYTGGAGTLTFELAGNTYIPYFFAEATEVTPCEIIFKDQAGAELFRVQTIEGATLDTLPDVSLLPVAGENYRFRGWFYTNGKKAHLGDPINGNTTIQAKVTEEEHATVGSIQTYDLTNPYFYPEDHETIDMTGGYYHDAQHGWAFKNNEGFAVEIAGKAVVVLEICQYGTADATWNVGADALDETVSAVGTADGEQITIRVEHSEYNGFIGLLQNTGGENYLHKVTVYNVENFLEKDENTGYIMVPSGDAAAFVLALAQAESGDKIFLPNGVYDLGETVLTTISKNNIAIIGQSMEGVIIKNAPDAKTESIDKTATLRIAKNVTGTYIQDLTIQNALDYYKSDNGRAVALWDQGKQTVCKNVRLLSHQDTYYSNLVGGTKYFEDCEIHGTVDFICGDGSVYFKNVDLVCEQRAKDGGGSDALTASNADASDKGYVFESCSVRYAENIEGTKPVVSFGRAWNNSPKTIFLNTLLADDLNMVKDASAQKDKIQRWTLGGMNILPEKFGEYNSVNTAGEVVSPASNNVTFVLGSAEKQMETILTAEEAATYTMEYTLGDWAATAADDATQAVCEEQWENLEADAIYMAENEGEFVMLLKGSEVMDKLAVYDGVTYTLRKANARGGFGLTAEQQHQGIDNCSCMQKAEKIIRNGQVIIVRDGKEFNVLGAQL